MGDSHGGARGVVQGADIDVQMPSGLMDSGGSLGTSLPTIKIERPPPRKTDYGGKPVPKKASNTRAIFAQRQRPNPYQFFAKLTEGGRSPMPSPRGDGLFGGGSPGGEKEKGSGEKKKKKKKDKKEKKSKKKKSKE